MEVKVINNMQNVKPTITQDKDGNIQIIINKISNLAPLGQIKEGVTVKIGKREYIVLEQFANNTAIIAKDFVKEMSFGDTGDYITSNIRKFCNGEFLNELATAVGMDNIVEHTVNLVADDGTGKGKTCKDKVSILTTENYRRYREFLKAYGEWWWTATRINYDDEDYARGICYVSSRGVLGWGGCDYYCNVRPFCILNSSVMVTSI